jgi:sortase A
VPAVRWIERLLLLIGLVCLATVAYAYFDARFTEREEGRRLDAAIREHRESAARSAARSAAGPAEKPAAETDSFASFSAPGAVAERKAAEPAPPELGEGALVGRLEIPRLGLSAIVLEGVEARTLRRGAGHIPGTVLPFQHGNVGIAGHRDSFFRALKDIGKNDIITLATPEGTYRYQVEWTRIVTPDDTEVLDDPGMPALTLVTCYPFYYVGSAPKRFIVRASRIADESSLSAPSP